MADADNQEDNLIDEERQEDAIVDEPADKQEGQEEELDQEEQNDDDSQEDVDDDAQEEEPEKPMSRREKLRIVDILGKYGKPEDQPSQKAPKSSAGFLDYENELDAPEELIARLQEDRQKYGESMLREADQRLQATEFRMQLNIDAPRVEAKYKFLDKNSDEFNPSLAQAVNTMYLSYTGYDSQRKTVVNPDIRYADFVEGIAELASEIASNQVRETTDRVRKQASKTGIRPNGSSATKKLNLNKAPQEMSDEELTAFLTQYYPQQ